MTRFAEALLPGLALGRLIDRFTLGDAGSCE
jgi:hypothetical protein